MTQLGELRDAHQKLRDAGIKLYAISYDDQQVLEAFARDQAIPFPLLSDVDSRVIRAYGVLNTALGRSGGPLQGVAFPGTFLTDENGTVVEKFFYDTYKRRHSAESLIDRALGEILLEPDEPIDVAGDDAVRVTAALRGGGGSLKQGAERRVVVRFELADGLHIYGEPVPEGMVPTRVAVAGPPGLAVEEPVYPPTELLRLESLDLQLPVWSGTVDVLVPVYALSELASECSPLDKTSVTLEVTVHYQACTDRACLMPKSERLQLEVPLEPVDVQAISLHMGHGQREAGYDGEPHLRRLLRRKIRENPLGFLRFALWNLRVELAARLRRQRSAR